MIDNSKTQTNKSQTEITPEDAINLLKKGNNRFLKNKFLNRDYKEQISNSSNGQ